LRSRQNGSISLSFGRRAQAGDRPVFPVGDRFFEQRRRHTQRRFALNRRRSGRHARGQRVHTAPAEITAPEPNRVLSHTERLCDLRAGPTGQSEQHSACTICFPAITGPRERGQSQTLFVACNHRRLAAHAPPTRIGASRESQNQRVGQTAGICLAPQPRYTGTSDPPIGSGCCRSQRRS
jgi:hypothetical protein